MNTAGSNKLKAEMVRLVSQLTPDSGLMYPKTQVFVWAKTPWGWTLVDMYDYQPR